jgi:hypothetical protein
MALSPADQARWDAIAAIYGPAYANAYVGNQVAASGQANPLPTVTNPEAFDAPTPSPTNPNVLVGGPAPVMQAPGNRPAPPQPNRRVATAPPTSPGAFVGQSSAEAGQGSGYHWTGTRWVTTAEWATMPPGATAPSGNPSQPGNNSSGAGSQTPTQVAGAVIPGVLFADDAAGSIGAKVLAAVAALGRAPTDDEALAIWRQAGLDAGQAATVHQFVKNWQMVNGAIDEGRINDLLGQVRAGQRPDATKWRVPSTNPPGSENLPGAPGGTTAPPAGTGTPATADGGAAVPDYDAANPFLAGQNRAALDNLIREKGFGGLATRLIGNYEDRSGARFAESIRPLLGSRIQGLQGLLNLRSGAGEQIDEPGSAGDYAAKQMGGGTVYDVSGQGTGRGLLQRALDHAQAEAAAGRQQTGLFAPGTQARSLQQNALTSALGLDIAPSMVGTVDDVVREVMNRFNTLVPGDAAAQSRTGSALEFAKSLGLF